MTVLKLLADQRLWFAAAGAAAVFLWHGCVVRGIELELAAEREKKQQVVIEYREREAVDNGKNIADYNKAQENAQKEINDLRDKLADGAISIRLCKADALRATVAADNSRAAEEQARADQRRLEETVLRVMQKARTQENWIESAHEFINRE